jgi:lysophospholipase L1-like esterase
VDTGLCTRNIHTIKMQISYNIVLDVNTLGAGSPVPPTNLNVWAFGDSIAAGAGFTLGPVTPAGAMDSWNGAAFVPITTTDISTVGPTRGTWYKQFALDYYNRTGGKLRILNSGFSGSTWAVDGAGSGNWTTAGALWAPALASAQAMVAASGPLDLILICLGINDARHATAAATVKAAMDGVIAATVAAFPGVPIGIVQIGALETGGVLNTIKLYDYRWKLRERMQNVSEVFLISHNGSYWQQGVTDVYYQSDNLHLAQAGNNLMGSQFANWSVQKSKGYSKEALSWITGCVPTTAGAHAPDSYNATVATLADAEVAAGNFYLLTQLVLPGGFSDLDLNHDYAGLIGLSDNLGSPTFVQYQGADFDGTSDRQGGWNPSCNNGLLETFTDFLCGAMIAVNNSANPSDAALFGRQVVAGAGNPVVMVKQNAAGNVSYWSLDGTVSLAAGGLTRFAVDTMYTVGRNGGTKELYVDSTLNASAAVAVGGAFNGSVYSMNYTLVAAFNQGLQGRQTCWFVAQRTGFNLAAHVTAVKAFIAARRLL